MCAKTAMIRMASSLMLLSGLGAAASSVIQADLLQLTASSDVIVRGQVKKIESRWTGDGRIVTDSTIEVVETLKGTQRRTVVIQQPGGVVGDLGQHVSGLATFQQNEEVVVFLEKAGPHYAITGLSQGKYRVERSTDGRSVFAVSAATESRLIDRETGQAVEPRVQPILLETLRRRVKHAVRLRAGQSAP